LLRLFVVYIRQAPRMKRIVPLAIVLAITCITSALALPLGAPPPKDYAVSEFWYGCVGPVTVRMQNSAQIYASSDTKSIVAAQLRRGQRVTVLEGVIILKQPGLAVVRGPFENNNLLLSPGTEVYVMQEWEIDYFHTWLNGKEVEGGLPIGNPYAFAVERHPVVERWVRIKVPQFGAKVWWALDTEVFRDDNALNRCEKAYRQ